MERSAGIDPERLAKIPIRMRAFVEQGTIAGAVTLVAHKGTVVSLEAVGYKDLEGMKPMTADTIFQIRSATKPVTATGITILMEEGALVLAEPVEWHLPEFKGVSVAALSGDSSGTGKVPSRPITIHDLLTHTAGIRDSPEDYGIRSEWATPLAEAVAAYAQQPLLFQPGTKFLYSNVGYSILGRVIEVVSDQQYHEFIRARIFEPLGMNDSFFFPPDEKLDRIAKAYALDGDKLKESAYYVTYRKERLNRQRNPCPAWGMYSTALDLFAFLQMMLDGGAFRGQHILSRGAVELMTRVHTGDLEWERPDGVRLRVNRGLGWRVAAEPHETLPLMSVGSFFHRSLAGCRVWVDPKKRLVGVFLVQRFDWPPRSLEPEVDTFTAMASAAVLD